MKVLGLFLLVATVLADYNISSVSKVYITEHEPAIIRVAVNTAYGEMWYLLAYPEDALNYQVSEVTGIYTPIEGTEGMQTFIFTCKSCNDGAVYELYLGLKQFLEGEPSMVREYLVEVTPSWDN